MFRKILIPLDGTPMSEQILSTVRVLAEKLQAKLLLLSVIDPRALDPIGAWETHIRESLQKTVEHLKKEHREAEGLVVCGIPQEEIVRTAERENCDLIAMLSHGRNLLGLFLLGSVAYHVLRLSSVPVFILTPEKAEDFPKAAAQALPRIVVALDGSRAAEGSLSFAQDLARSFQAEISLVQVVPSSEDLPSFLARLFAAEERRAAESAEEYLARTSQQVAGKEFSVQHRVLRGATVPQLVQFLSQGSGSSITLLCTRGTSEYTPYVLGSTSLSLLRSFGGPFLLIPPSHEVVRF